MQAKSLPYKHQLLSLLLQHGQVEVDELEVRCRRGVVSASQLCVELLGHDGDANVYLHAKRRKVLL